jgi:hypothetical protein
VTGGYFADPGVKDVPDLARLGFPLAEVDENGGALLTKVDGSGGRLTSATCKEQLLYELHRPDRYLTPDVTADFTGVRFREIARDRVEVRGASGTARPERLKVSVGYSDGFIGEGQISYAGPGARERGELALSILEARLKLLGMDAMEHRAELIGVNAMHGPALGADRKPYEVRVRLAVRTATRVEADLVGQEVEALYLNGPGGGGGVTQSVREVIAAASALIPREAVRPAIKVLELA